MPPSATAPRLLHELARPQEGLAPQDSVGTAAEWLRSCPYPCVPVLSGGLLIGAVTESSLAHYLLPYTEPTERRRALEAPIEETVLVPTAALSPFLPVSELLALLDKEHTDALPIAEGNGLYYGMVGRADLVAELFRPLALPQIGGMATPVGVHLSTGARSAGVPPWALVATGLSFSLTQALLLLGLSALAPRLPALPLPPAWRESSELVAVATSLFAAFLGLIRLSPLAGFHAAEHQVVHALESRVPLLPERVALLPRVHPRCGTNLMAASFLLGLGGALTPLLGEASYLLSGLLALLFWRSLGSWLQAHLTTKPASHAQLQQAIAAAQALLVQHADAEKKREQAPTLLRRLRHSGLPELLLGFLLGIGLVWALSPLVPPLEALFAPERALYAKEAAQTHR